LETEPILKTTNDQLIAITATKSLECSSPNIDDDVNEEKSNGIRSITNEKKYSNR